MKWPWVSRARYEALEGMYRCAMESHARAVDDIHSEVAQAVIISNALASKKLDAFTSVEWRLLAEHAASPFRGRVEHIARLSDRIRELGIELVAREQMIALLRQEAHV